MSKCRLRLYIIEYNHMFSLCNLSSSDKTRGAISSRRSWAPFYTRYPCLCMPRLRTHDKRCGRHARRGENSGYFTQTKSQPIFPWQICVVKLVLNVMVANEIAFLSLNTSAVRGCWIVGCVGGCCIRITYLRTYCARFEAL